MFCRSVFEIQEISHGAKVLISASRVCPACPRNCLLNGSRDSSSTIAKSRQCRHRLVTQTLSIDSAHPHSSGNVALPRHDLSYSSDNDVLASLPRHHFLLKRGCAAVMNMLCRQPSQRDRAAACAWTSSCATLYARRACGSLRCCATRSRAAAAGEAAAAVAGSQGRRRSGACRSDCDMPIHAAHPLQALQA